jgi:hypothetical protein
VVNFTGSRFLGLLPQTPFLTSKGEFFSSLLKRLACHYGLDCRPPLKLKPRGGARLEYWLRWFSSAMAGGFLPYLNHEPPYSYYALLGTSFPAATSTPIPASILRAVNLRDGKSRQGSNP